MAMDQAVVTSRVRREAANPVPGGPLGRQSFAEYQTDGFFDEMFDEVCGPRPDCRPLYDRIRSISADDLVRRQRAADRSMVQLGITFNVYGDRQGDRKSVV